MMKKILVSCLMLLAIPLFGQESAGTVELDITTLPNGESFSPKHVLAIWVEDGSGAFVKTLKLRAKDRKKYLYTWNDISGGDVTDATTGSTLSSHQTHSLSWNCTDVDGNVVTDGSYSMMIEYTSAHAQGPLMQIDFTKAGDEVTVTPSDETYFTSMQLVYTPDQPNGTDLNIGATEIRIYPVPVREQLFVTLDLPVENRIRMDIYSVDMKHIEQLYHGDIDAGRHVISRPISHQDLVSGTYVLVIRGKNLHVARKITLE